jgi:molybdopterin-guanine dinucleotide biosynthesis protein A
MGFPKAWLPFGEETMLARVVQILREQVAEIVLVAAEEQSLPPLAGDVTLTRDERPARGPLEGLSAGLRALSPKIAAAYVTSCDVPLLQGAFVERMFAELGTAEIAVPLEERFHHPLAADQLRPTFLFDRVATNRIPVNDLRQVDPDLKTLRNLNHPADYYAAVTEAGFVVPEEIRQKLG